MSSVVLDEETTPGREAAPVNSFLSLDEQAGGAVGSGFCGSEDDSSIVASFNDQLESTTERFQSVFSCNAGSEMTTRMQQDYNDQVLTMSKNLEEFDAAHVAPLRSQFDSNILSPLQKQWDSTRTDINNRVKELQVLIQQHQHTSEESQDPAEMDDLESTKNLDPIPEEGSFEEMKEADKAKLIQELIQRHQHTNATEDPSEIDATQSTKDVETKAVDAAGGKQDEAHKGTSEGSEAVKEPDETRGEIEDTINENAGTGVSDNESSTLKFPEEDEVGYGQGGSVRTDPIHEEGREMSEQDLGEAKAELRDTRNEIQNTEEFVTDATNSEVLVENISAFEGMDPVLQAMDSVHEEGVEMSEQSFWNSQAETRGDFENAKRENDTAGIENENTSAVLSPNGPVESEHAVSFEADKEMNSEQNSEAIKDFNDTINDTEDLQDKGNSSSMDLASKEDGAGSDGSSNEMDPIADGEEKMSGENGDKAPNMDTSCLQDEEGASNRDSSFDEMDPIPEGDEESSAFVEDVPLVEYGSTPDISLANKESWEIPSPCSADIQNVLYPLEGILGCQNQPNSSVSVPEGTQSIDLMEKADQGFKSPSAMAAQRLGQRVNARANMSTCSSSDEEDGEEDNGIPKRSPSPGRAIKSQKSRQRHTGSGASVSSYRSWVSSLSVASSSNRTAEERIIIQQIGLATSIKVRKPKEKDPLVFCPDFNKEDKVMADVRDRKKMCLRELQRVSSGNCEEPSESDDDSHFVLSSVMSTRIPDGRSVSPSKASLLADEGRLQEAWQSLAEDEKKLEEEKRFVEVGELSVAKMQEEKKSLDPLEELNKQKVREYFPPTKKKRHDLAPDHVWEEWHVELQHRFASLLQRWYRRCVRERAAREWAAPIIQQWWKRELWGLLVRRIAAYTIQSFVIHQVYRENKTKRDAGKKIQLFLSHIYRLRKSIERNAAVAIQTYVLRCIYLRKKAERERIRAEQERLQRLYEEACIRRFSVVARRVCEIAAQHDAASCLRRAWTHRQSMKVLETKLAARRARKVLEAKSALTLYRALAMYHAKCVLRRKKEALQRKVLALQLAMKKLQARREQRAAVKILTRALKCFQFQQQVQRKIEERHQRHACRILVRAMKCFQFQQQVQRKIEERYQRYACRILVRVLKCFQFQCQIQRKIEHRQWAALVVTRAVKQRRAQRVLHKRIEASWQKRALKFLHGASFAI